MPLDEIARLEALEGADINEAKKVLAHEATKLCHGEEAAVAAAATAQKTFEQGGFGDDLPTADIPKGELESGIGILEVLCRVGLTATNGEARRFVQQGAVKVNDAKSDDARSQLTAADLNSDGLIKLSVGKKKHGLARAV